MSLVGSVAALLALASLTNGPASPPPEAPVASGSGVGAGAASTTRGSLPAPRGAWPAAAWGWPLEPAPEVIRPFAPPTERWLPGHRGVDLLASGPGAAVRTPAPGHVRFSGMVGGRDVLVIEHSGGLRSTFEPVTATLPVGSPVGRGVVVGLVTPASGHCEPRACLHWGVLRGNEYLDPLSFVQRQPLRLLPLG